MFAQGVGVGTSQVSWDRSHNRYLPPQTSDLGTYPFSLTSDLGTYPLLPDIRPGDLSPSPWHQTWEPTPFSLTSDLGTYPLLSDIRPGDLSPSQTSDLGTYPLLPDIRPGDLSPPPHIRPTPYCYWHLVVITADLFKPFHSRTYPPTPHQNWYWHLVVAT